MLYFAAIDLGATLVYTVCPSTQDKFGTHMGGSSFVAHTYHIAGFDVSMIHHCSRGCSLIICFISARKQML